MRATRAYLAGLGTAGTLVLAASILFVLGSAIVTYNGWPKLGGIGAPATQTLTAHPKSGSHSSRGLASVKVVKAQTGGAAGIPAAVAKRRTLLAQVGQGTVGHTRVDHSSSAAISHPVAARQPTHSSTPTKTGSGSGSGGTGSGSTGTGSTGGGTTTVTAPAVPVVATPTPVASTPTTPGSTGSGSGSGGSGSGSGSGSGGSGSGSGGSGSGSGGSGSGSGGSGSSNPGTPVVKSGSGTVVVTLPARPTGTPVISVTGSSGTSPRVTSTSGSSPSPSSVSSSSGSSSSTSTTTVSSPTSITSPRVSIPGPVISRTGVSAGGSSSAHLVPGLGNALGGAPHYGSPYGSRACPRGH